MSQTDVVDSHVFPQEDTQGTNYGVRTGGAISLASSRLYLSDVCSSAAPCCRSAERRRARIRTSRQAASAPTERAESVSDA